MSAITDADDDVVRAAYGVLTGDSPQGTNGVRRITNEDGTDSVYRIDADADPADVDAAEVAESGEFPDSEAVLWRADRDLVEREAERRGLVE
jgi:hypothetical protein